MVARFTACISPIVGVWSTISSVSHLMVEYCKILSLKVPRYMYIYMWPHQWSNTFQAGSNCEPTTCIFFYKWVRRKRRVWSCKVTFELTAALAFSPLDPNQSMGIWSNPLKKGLIQDTSKIAELQTQLFFVDHQSPWCFIKKYILKKKTMRVRFIVVDLCRQASQKIYVTRYQKFPG